MEQPTEEQLRNMSPEELKEYQKKNCLFCHIIEGKVASKKVYEDDVCLAILDINPGNPGHVILMPKEHYAIIPMMPGSDLSKMMVSARRISTAILRAVKAEGINMFIANGAVAGQKSPHAMVHLIPRKEGDNITAFTLPQNDIDPGDQEKLRRMIKSKVDAMFGIVEDEPPLDVGEPGPPKPEEQEKRVEKPEEISPEKKETPAPKPDPEKDKRKPDLDAISGLFKEK